MPVLPPRAIADLDADLQAEIRGGEASGVLTNTVSVRMWAHRPEIALHWVRTLRASHERSLLDERLRELVRLRIASHTQCHSCQIARKSDQVTEEDVACIASDDARWTPEEQAALTFADLFATDYFAIDDATFANLARFFSQEQVMELGLFAALMLAGGRLNYVMRGWEGDEKGSVLAAAGAA